MKSKTSINLVLRTFSLLALQSAAMAAGVSGAIFTTDANGTVVNQNLYSSKCDVYLDGGPGPHAPAKAAGLPTGDYFFQVTDPSGAQLLSTDPVSNRRFHVSNGVITAFTGSAPGFPAHPTGVDQDHASLGAITIRLANLNCPTDFLDTPNTGDVYKVWATPVASFIGDTTKVDNPCSGGCQHGFVSSQSKTDNFKAVAAPSATFSLTIQKQFIDLPGNAPTPDLLGWGMSVTDSSNVTNHYTTDATAGQVALSQLAVGTYTVTEDPNGPVPNPLSCSGASPYQVFLNGVPQAVGSSLQFTWNSNQPVTILFVNILNCGF